MMIEAPRVTHRRRILLLSVLALTSGCTERLADNAFKADGGCKVRQYNVEWAAKNIDRMNWDGPCLNREANGYGKLKVVLLNKQQETYEGTMRDGKFDTTQKTQDQKSVYVTGNKRLSGEFRAGRFLSGQIYVDDKIDFDGILYQPSRRYASGKSYFPDGSYIDGSFYDKEGNVSTTGPGVYQGIVYNEKNEAVSWIYQERVFNSAEAWAKEISSQKAQLEAKAKREADIKAAVAKLMAQFDQTVQAKSDTPADLRLQSVQRRDASQAKSVLLDKLVWQCRTAGCDGLEYLRATRDAEVRQSALLKEAVAKLPPADKLPEVKTPVDAKAAVAGKSSDGKTAAVKPAVNEVKPVTLAKLQVSEGFVKDLQALRLLLKLK